MGFYFSPLAFPAFPAPLSGSTKPSPFAYLQQELRDYCVNKNEIKVTGADVAVRVRCRVVAIQVEQAIIQVAVIVATNIEHDTTGVIVAIVSSTQ